MKSFNVLILFVLSIFLFQSCTQDELNDDVITQEEAEPELPSMESFIMPFESFTEADTNQVAREMSDSRSTSVFRNWFYAATNVVIYQSTISAMTAIPIATFAEAFNHQPTNLGNGIFEWEYTIDAVDGTFICKLTGELIGNSKIQWNMFVTKVGVYENVNFYSGLTSTDEKAGEWILRKNPNNLTDALLIEYSGDGNGTAFIKYTNIKEGGNEEGSFVEFRTDRDAVLNRAYDIFSASEDNLIEIKWNKQKEFGTVKSPAFFNDTDFHCWNMQKKNVDCD